MRENIEIGKKTIGPGAPVFIVAEIGMNHNGDVELGKKIIKEAAICGVDAVKFQHFKTENFISRDFADFKKREKYELGCNETQTLFNYARKNGVEFFSTPFDDSSVKLLNNIGVPVFKIASADITNIPLLRKVAKIGKPILFSTGYSTVSEIFKAYETLKESGASQLGILHCVASYPTEDKDVNLSNITSLRRIFPENPIGFSDHSSDFELIPSVAVATGACIIEKHFTIDRNLPGYDHKMSLDPEMMKKMVRNIRRVEKAIGEPRNKTGVIESEKTRKDKARRYLYWAKSGKKGEKITREHIIAKRSGTRGVSCYYYDELRNRKFNENVEADTKVQMHQVI